MFNFEKMEITFETAKIAKEKGFDLPCRFAFDTTGRLSAFTGCAIHDTHNKNSTVHLFDTDTEEFTYPKLLTTAPTQSVLQKWLREVHGIDVLVDVEYYLKGRRYICNIFSFKEDLTLDSFNTYKETLEAGLQEALKLISC